MDGYVNKEINIALDKANYKQAAVKFIAPLLVSGMAAEAGRGDLRDFHQHRLGTSSETEDLATFVKDLTRDFQRRIKA